MAKRKVIIEVSGGVAEVVEAPPDTEVVIRDYDNCPECGGELCNGQGCEGEA